MAPTTTYLTSTEHLAHASLALRGIRPSLAELRTVAAEPDRVAARVDREGRRRLDDRVLAGGIAAWFVTAPPHPDHHRKRDDVQPDIAGWSHAVTGETAARPPRRGVGRPLRQGSVAISP